MTLAFLASRKGYLKVMGSLIQAALDRGHRVVLLRDPGQDKPGEATTASDFQWWPRAELVDYPWGAPLLPVLEAHGITDLVGPSLYLVLKGMKRLKEVPDLKRRGIRLYSVDYGFETATSDPEGYRVIDVTFYQSEFQRSDVHWREPRFKEWDGDFRVLRREKVNLKSHSEVSGSTMLDQRVLIDPAAVRSKHGLPGDRPVVLFMSLKMAVPEPWRAVVWGDSLRVAARAVVASVRKRPLATLRLVPRMAGGLGDRLQNGNGYRRLLASVQHFCDVNGAVLVIKSREKNQDPPFLRDFTRYVIDKDDGVFPYDSLELMAISNLCIHFQSGAVLEAAFCGVPSLSIRVPLPFGRDNPAYKELWDAEPHSFQNWDGVVWSTDPRGAVALLAERKLGDFAVQPGARRDYVVRYVGFDDTRSSERVLDVIGRAAREG